MSMLIMIIQQCMCNNTKSVDENTIKVFTTGCTQLRYFFKTLWLTVCSFCISDFFNLILFIYLFIFFLGGGGGGGGGGVTQC